MTRPGMARSVVIPKKLELSPGVVRSNCRTLGITVDELIASAPYPLGYDLDRAAEVCGRAIEEVASIDIP